MAYDFSAYDNEMLTLAIQNKKANGSKNPEMIEAMEKELVERDNPTPKPAPMVFPRIRQRIIANRYHCECKGWLSTEDKEKICKMREERHTHIEIAMSVGISLRTVQRVLNDALMTEFSDQVSHPVEVLEQVIRLHNERKSNGEICSMLNLDHDVVRRWINKQTAHNIEMGITRFQSVEKTLSVRAM